MALNNIKQQLRQEALKAEEKKREAEGQYLLAQEKNREEREKWEHILPCLIDLEGYFWECVNDFSQLTGLSIKERNRSWFYPLIATPSRNNPRLTVELESPVYDFTYNRIELVAGFGLIFHARCIRIGSRYHSIENHGNVWANSEIKSQETFNVEETKKWLKRQFENYYRKIEALKLYK